MSNKISQARRDKAKELAKNDLKEASKFCSFIGDMLKANGECEEALEEFQEDLELCCKRNDLLGQANAHRQIGECYTLLFRHEEAVKEQLKYYKLVVKCNDSVETQRAYATIGYTFLVHAQSLSNLDEVIVSKSENALKHALSLCEGIKEKVGDREYEQMRSRIYINLGLIYDLRGDIKVCNDYFQKAIHLCRNYDFKEDLLRCQTSLAAFYQKKGDLNTASRFCDESIMTAKQLNNKTLISETLMAKGEVMMLLRDFEGGKRYFKKAYHIKSSKSQDALKSLKIAYFICDDYNKLMKSKDIEDEIELNDKLGDHFVALHLYYVATEFYKKELQLSLDSGKPKSDLAKIYVSLAQTYADNNQFEEALRNFEEELKCYAGNATEECNTLLNIAYFKENLNVDSSELIEIYETALEKAGDNRTLRFNVLKQYSSYFNANEIKSDRASEVIREFEGTVVDEKSEDEQTDSDDERDQENNVYDNFHLSEISSSSCGSDSETDSKDNKKVSSPKKRTRNKKKANIKLNEVGETPLHRACIAGNLKVVQRLIERGHPVNCRDFCGWLPLHEAVNHGQIEIVRFLIEKGAHINDPGGVKCDGITPLHDACSCGHIDIIRLLMRKGARVCVTTKSGDTPLDCFEQWKKRVDLNDIEKKDCSLLEQELKDAMNKAGFVKESAPKVAVVPPRERSPSTSPYSSPMRNDSSPIRLPEDDDSDKDYHDPKVAKTMYREVMTNLRRTHEPNRDLFQEPGTSKKLRHSALLNEGSFVGNDWLINDCDSIRTKKRPLVGDAYESFGNAKKRLSDGPVRERKERTRRYEVFENEEDDIELVEEQQIDDEILSRSANRVCMNREETVSLNESFERSKTTEGKKSTSSREESTAFCVNVHIENNKFRIAVPNRTMTCEWLKYEVCQRYFKLFNVKPVVLLQTTDGAILSEEDKICDVVTDDVLAKVESWTMDPLIERYKEMCVNEKVTPINDLLNVLQTSQISGRFVLNNVNLQPQQVKVLIKSWNRQTKLREIDISFSNILMDDYLELFFSTISSLTNLQILKLKCTSLSSLDLLLNIKCPNLLILDLSYNYLDDASCDQLINLVKTFSKLTELYLRNNEFTNKTFMRTDFAETIKNSKLESIHHEAWSINSNRDLFMI